jgi:cytochrome c oxidase cbb3-type subunit III
MKSVLLTFAALAVLLCAACNSAPGRPGPASQVTSPREITNFDVLYTQNCTGCHGRDSKSGAAIALGDPVYLAIADDAVIRRATVNGVPGTSMPAFAKSAGGTLTDKQIDAIVGGIRSWAKPDILRGVAVPPYAAQTPGDPQHGADVYVTYCSECHGPEGRGDRKASSIVDGSYLALVSDQGLRTIVIVGWPDLGMPDWRGDVPGRPLSAQEVSDVVAWIGAQRPPFPGQPYPITSVSPQRE